MSVKFEMSHLTRNMLSSWFSTELINFNSYIDRQARKILTVIIYRIDQTVRMQADLCHCCWDMTHLYNRAFSWHGSNCTTEVF